MFVPFPALELQLVIIPCIDHLTLMLYTTSLVSQVCLLLAFSANFTATALAESFAPPSNVYELNDHLNRLGLSQDGNADQISQSIAAASLGGVDPNRGNCKKTVS